MEKHVIFYFFSYLTLHFSPKSTNNLITVWYFRLILFPVIKCASGNAEKNIKKNPASWGAWQGHAHFLKPYMARICIVRRTGNLLV